MNSKTLMYFGNVGFMKNLGTTILPNLDQKQNVVSNLNGETAAVKSSMRPIKLVKKQSLTKKLSIKPFGSLRRSK